MLLFKRVELLKLAADIGFDACGVTQVACLSREREKLEAWLKRGCHGEMTYMAKNIEKREDPSLLVDGARSLIVTLTNYYMPFCQKTGVPVAARYAYGKDYHKVVKARLFELFARLKERVKGEELRGRVFVDSAPVFEREWARRAGLGWIGRNSLLVHPKLGSFCFIGLIISNFEPDSYSEPENRNFCGNCQRCIDACPTGALAVREVDARRCIAYNTIELKGEIPLAVKEKMGQRFFGCDACLEVCPWNQKLKTHQVTDFLPNPWLMRMTREEWNALDEPEFRTRFKDSPLERPGLEQLKRNLR